MINEEAKTQEESLHPLTLQMFMDIQSKNNDMIKALLPKMHNLFNQTEMLESKMIKVETKLTRVERDNENLHYELRSNHLEIDGRLKNILKNYDEVSRETKAIREKTDQLSRKFNQQGDFEILSHLKGRSITNQRSSKPPESSQQESEPVNESEETQNKSSYEGLQTMRENLRLNSQHHTFKRPQTSKALEGIPSSLKKSTRMKLKRQNSISLNLDSDNEKQVKNKVHFSFGSDKKSASINGSSSRIPAQVRGNQRKGSLKRIPSQKAIKPGSSSNIKINQADNKKEKMSKKKSYKANQLTQLKEEMEKYYSHNLRMSKNYEALMNDYLQKQEKGFAKIRTDLEAQLQPIKNQIEIFKDRLETIDPVTREDSVHGIKLDLLAKIQKINQTLGKSVKQEEWRDMVIEVNERFKFAHEQRKKFANRPQTKRAIEFLENKLNNICQRLDLPHSKASLAPTQRNYHRLAIDQNGCLVRQSQQRSETETVRKGNKSPSNRLTHKKAASHHRFNENEEDMYQSDEQRYTVAEGDVGKLKKRSYEILSAGKSKPRPMLKRSPKVIFQYD